MRSKLDNMGKITQEETGGEIVFMKMVATGIMHGNVHVNAARVSLYTFQQQFIYFYSVKVCIFIFLRSM